MSKGKISVHTDNLMPIIKKWLYSDGDIFIRELVSNAQDAIMKHKKLVSIGKAEKNDDEYEIKVIVNKTNQTITITDNGIGMTLDEVEKYINQVAFSGAEEFVKKYEEENDKKSQIIGHFGLGFYSAFMAASTVEINTLSYLPEQTPVHWVSDGGTEYKISDGAMNSRGTQVILHISDDSMEYLELTKLRSVLEKYCSFLPIKIYLIDAADDDELDKILINDTEPLWLKKPSDCTDEDYKSFYHKVFMDFNDPLFWIHLNVDYPFNLKGILYFPKLNHEFQSIEGQIKLYNNQVYIADNIKEVTPEYLMLLKGVIDCPDLPLNVSRSFLQNDGYVSKVSSHITKKVADKLTGLYKADDIQYSEYWNDINPFVKYGCIRDDKFYERVKDIIIFKNYKDGYTNLKSIADSDNKELYYITNVDAQSQYVELLESQDINMVILNNAIDNHFISFLEFKHPELKFKRVDSYIAESLKSDKSDDCLCNNLIEIFSSLLPGTKIEAEKLKTENPSAIFIISEQARRMEEMSKMYGNIGMINLPKSEETLMLNLSNPLIMLINGIADDDERNLICKEIISIAKLSQNSLNGNEKNDFIKRTTEIMIKLLNK